MSLAIMQPYFLPYIGYFHLIEAADEIIFYDDVNYIKRGWINRNRLLNKDSDYMFTIPTKGASQNKLIYEVAPIYDAKSYQRIESFYKKAPYFNEVKSVILKLFSQDYMSISDLAINSIVYVYQYLGIEIKWRKSSICSPQTRGMEKSDRLIQITQQLGYDGYVNLIGGENLYCKDYFLDRGIELKFIKSNYIVYKQFSGSFISNLSILDVLMFNSKDMVLEFLKDFEVI